MQSSNNLLHDVTVGIKEIWICCKLYISTQGPTLFAVGFPATQCHQMQHFRSSVSQSASQFPSLFEVHECSTCARLQQSFCLSGVPNISIVVQSRCVSKAWRGTSSSITTAGESTTPWTCLSWRATGLARCVPWAKKENTDMRKCNNGNFCESMKSCSFLLCVLGPQQRCGPARFTWKELCFHSNVQNPNNWVAAAVNSFG